MAKLPKRFCDRVQALLAGGLLALYGGVLLIAEETPVLSSSLAASSVPLVTAAPVAVTFIAQGSLTLVPLAESFAS